MPARRHPPILEERIRPMLVIDAAAVRELFPMPAAIEQMREALERYSAATIVQPLRTVVQPPEAAGMMAAMPAWAGPDRGFGIKTVTIHPGNPARGLDTHQGTVTMFDRETGIPTAVMDAAAITEIRTGAVSAVATRALADPEAHDLAIIGSGAQARSHLEAMAAVRRLDRIRVWSRTEAHAKAFAEWAGDRFGPDVEVHGSVAGALEGANLVCTAVASVEPVVTDGMLAPGAHVNAVGACLPTVRELSTDAVAAATVFADSLESALAEAGDLVIPIRAGDLGHDHVVAEIGEVLLGRHAGRSTPAEITLFKSLGLAIEDVMAGAFIESEARSRGLGTQASLS
jgi:ornithine cyclodeaminase/alanine dehydrogenase-like protein (mu-crystallin family)